MRIRKQVYDLSLLDLDRFQIWEFALDEEGYENQDEATVRPVELAAELDPRDGIFIVSAMFRLADGTNSVGYLTPTANANERQNIGKLQPVIVTAGGHVGFWHGVIEPTSHQVAGWYLKLGKSAASQVFPIVFESTAPLVGGSIKGSVDGFQILDLKTDGVRTIR